jgi:hypothetical protein
MQTEKRMAHRTVHKRRDQGAYDPVLSRGGDPRLVLAPEAIDIAEGHGNPRRYVVKA